MSPLRRILAALLTALALAAGSAAPAAHGDEDGGSGGGAKDNAATAENTTDDSSLFRFAFSVREVSGDVVDETNTAVAYASCERCQTVAIALQVVLVTSETTPTTITPQNVAIAVNENCATCQTLALAYQFVVGRGGPVRFTERGRREAARIVRAFRALEQEGLSVDQIRERAALLRDELAELLRTELVPVESDDEGDEGDEGGEQVEERRDEDRGGKERSGPDTAQPETAPRTAPKPEPAPDVTSPGESTPTTPESSPERAPEQVP